MADLQHENITALPLVHGRVPFAIEARRRMLDELWDAIAVELPESISGAVNQAIDMLPEIGVVVYREVPEFLDPDDRRVWYVVGDPCDGIIEAIRVARGERTPVHWVDADLGEFVDRRVQIPDCHAVHGLGVELWYDAIQPWLSEAASQEGRSARTPHDGLREEHMAKRLADLSETLGPDRRILFLCGVGHWEGVRRHLEGGTGRLHDASGPEPDQISVTPLHAASLPMLLGETPHTTWLWEQHRAGIALDDYDQTFGLKDLLQDARAHYELAYPDALEKATPQALRVMLSFIRKLCVRRRRLIPDTWTLAAAAKGCVGNDFSLSVLRCASRYPPNGVIEDLEGMGEDGGREPGPAPHDPEPETAPTIDLTQVSAQEFGLMMSVPGLLDTGGPCEAQTRTPGELKEWRALPLRRRPDRQHRQSWVRGWNPTSHCSWPPEDVVIENFRDYVSQRALGLAGLSMVRTEPFTSSFKDGIALRETLRDWHKRRIHVKEEPRVVGDVGALVLIFEEDDFGIKFPWRTTWMAEHDNESTLAFYSTDPKDDIVGPGIGRMFYGGCMFLFPPRFIPCIWSDLRFERARRPSERLLLAAIFYSEDRYVAYAAPAPPPDAVRQQAEALGKHIVYIPLSSFSSTTLEKLRRAHVLNGSEVRSWADRFIR